MADVLLREYVDQLRDLLHAGKHADAFTLGQHILHYFPKHVETYTLLAQASLQVNDLAGATDLFRRVLSADPENVLALAGMALLSETQEKYDEALWYLERAYEVQPGNDDLRRELLRIREMFYGAAPARLELTAGALARVYARQGQYAHAVNEYRRLLRNDSKRYDARVGLAETLYRAGRTDEAAQMAQSVMADAPYALKPNLILGVLWSENGVPEGQQFLQRAQQLDPEYRVARQLIGEQFANGQTPRLPVLGERSTASPMDNQAIGDVNTQAFTPDAASARATEFLRELERSQEPEEPVEETLFGDFDALSLVEEIPSEATASQTSQTLYLSPEIEGTAAEAASPFAEIAAPTPQTAAPEVKPAPRTRTPEEIERAIHEAEVAHANKLAAEQQASTEQEQIKLPPEIFRTPVVSEPVPVTPPAPAAPVTPPAAPPKKTSDFASRLTRSKSGEGLTAETLAAAATSLATSIALDKSSQPAPTRRNHPAIPKVRPVIRGVAEKLPTWLRLGSTPAAAPASFDAVSSSTTETITAPADDRPAWLVEAQAAAEEAPVTQAGKADELPNWLKPSGAIETPKPTVEPPRVDMPSWLQDVAPVETTPPSTPVLRAQPSSAALPDWLKDATEPEEPVVPAAPPAGAQAEPIASITEPLPTPAKAEPVTPPIVAVEPPAARVVEPVFVEPTPPAPLPTLPVAQEKPAVPLQSDNVESQAASADVPEAKQESSAPIVEPTPAAEPEPVEQPAPVNEGRTQNLTMPDSATMLQMARDKRDSGDLKGALDLYERVMHRRPNHLELLTADLQAIIQQGGAPTSANRLLGEAYAMAGRFKESLEQYRIAMGK